MLRFTTILYACTYHYFRLYEYVSEVDDNSEVLTPVTVKSTVL
jgi:hypothetical protein